MNSLAERLLALCDSVHGQLGPGAARRDVAEVRTRLVEPLRVAVTGRVSAGKSTIVNALLERRVAPTAAGECTKIVTWYRGRPMEGAEVRMKNGDLRSIGLPDGRLPADVGVDPRDAKSIRVGLQNRTLENLTVIDTPGLDSASDDLADEDETFLRSATHDAMAQADAIIYVFKEPPGAADERVLEALRAQFESLELSVFNAVGALNMADKMGGSDDPTLSTARQMADRYESELGSMIGEIVPTIGVLAQTATADLRERDVRALCVLAQFSRDERELMLFSADRFRATHSDVAPEDRERVLELFDLFGLARALEWVDAGDSNAAALQRRLLETSGIGRLKTFVSETLGRRADALKAHMALRKLRRVAFSPVASGIAELGALRSELDDLLLEPEMHSLQEIWALQEVASGRVSIPDGLAGELRRLTVGGATCQRLGLEPGASQSEQEKLISDRADEWKLLSNSSFNRNQKRVAEVAWLSYMHLAEEVADGRR